MKLKVIGLLLLSTAVMLLMACGVSTEDIDAAVEARIASMPTPTPQIVIVEVEKEVVKEVEVIKEVEVEKIVYVEVEVVEMEEGVVAAPTPTPWISTGVALPVKVYEWGDISSEYEANRIVANSKYQNQTMLIRGVIDYIDYVGMSVFTGISSDGVKIPAVLLGSWDGNSNLFYCGLDSVDEVANLSVGDTVVVNGTFSLSTALIYGGEFSAYPCSIVE